MLSERRDLAAAKAFFRSAKAATGTNPDRVTSDGHDPYPRAIRTALGKTVTHRTNAYLNNRLEQDHRGIKGRIRCMRGFGSFVSAGRFCRGHNELRDFSVSVPSTASMSPPIVAVSVSFAEPPLCLRFLRPLERFLPCVVVMLTGAIPDRTRSGASGVGGLNTKLANHGRGLRRTLGSRLGQIGEVQVAIESRPEGRAVVGKWVEMNGVGSALTQIKGKPRADRPSPATGSSMV